MRHAKRTDKNHAELRDGLRKLGYKVYDFSHVGGGVADLCVKITPTMSVWVEVKASEKDKLTEAEISFQSMWHDVYIVAITVESAASQIEAVQIKYESNL